MKKLKTERPLTKSEAKAFMKRWEIVNTLEKKELVRLTANEKLVQLTMLMTLAKELDWTVALQAEVKRVRDRWNKLRRVYHV